MSRRGRVVRRLRLRAEVRREIRELAQPETCLSCDEPRVDSGEGRFCSACQDYEGTCRNDHCLTCGART